VHFDEISVVSKSKVTALPINQPGLNQQQGTKNVRLIYLIEKLHMLTSSVQF